MKHEQMHSFHSYSGMWFLIMNLVYLMTWIHKYLKPNGNHVTCSFRFQAYCFIVDTDRYNVDKVIK